jgi:hypothetical protein
MGWDEEGIHVQGLTRAYKINLLLQLAAASRHQLYCFTAHTKINDYSSTTTAAAAAAAIIIITITIIYCYCYYYCYYYHNKSLSLSLSLYFLFIFIVIFFPFFFFFLILLITSRLFSVRIWGFIYSFN